MACIAVKEDQSKGGRIMTGSGMAEYTVRPEYRLRLPGGTVVSHDFKTLEQSAKKEAHEAGVAVMEVHYPGGGGYILRYTRSLWGTVMSQREAKTW